MKTKGEQKDEREEQEWVQEHKDLIRKLRRCNTDRLDAIKEIAGAITKTKRF